MSRRLAQTAPGPKYGPCRLCRRHALPIDGKLVSIILHVHLEHLLSLGGPVAAILSQEPARHIKQGTDCIDVGPTGLNYVFESVGRLYAFLSHI